MAKKIRSEKNFWGETVHYDESGKKVGVSRPNSWGGMNHYDSSGAKVGESHEISGAAQPTGTLMETRQVNPTRISGVVLPITIPAAIKSANPMKGSWAVSKRI